MARIAVATAVATRDRFGGDQFPVLYTDGLMRIYKNPSGEIFVEDIRSGAKMRINSYNGLRFTVEGRIEPIPFNGGVAWLVSR